MLARGIIEGRRVYFDALETFEVIELILAADVVGGFFLEDAMLFYLLKM